MKYQLKFYRKQKKEKLFAKRILDYMTSDKLCISYSIDLKYFECRIFCNVLIIVSPIDLICNIPFDLLVTVAHVSRCFNRRSSVLNRISQRPHLRPELPINPLEK